MEGQSPGVVARIELSVLLPGPVKVVADHDCDHVHDVVPVISEGTEPRNRLPCPGRVIGEQLARDNRREGAAYLGTRHMAPVSAGVCQCYARSQVGTVAADSNCGMRTRSRRSSCMTRAWRVGWRLVRQQPIAN